MYWLTLPALGETRPSQTTRSSHKDVTSDPLTWPPGPATARHQQPSRLGIALEDVFPLRNICGNDWTLITLPSRSPARPVSSAPAFTGYSRPAPRSVTPSAQKRRQNTLDLQRNSHITDSMSAAKPARPWAFSLRCSSQDQRQCRPDTLYHTPSIAFRHLPPKEGCRKPVLGVWRCTGENAAHKACSKARPVLEYASHVWNPFPGSQPKASRHWKMFRGEQQDG